MCGTVLLTCCVFVFLLVLGFSVSVLSECMLLACGCGWLLASCFPLCVLFSISIRATHAACVFIHCHQPATGICDRLSTVLFHTHTLSPIHTSSLIIFFISCCYFSTMMKVLLSPPITWTHPTSILPALPTYLNVKAPPQHKST